MSTATPTPASASAAGRSPQISGLHPSMVLSAYLEPLVRGRRVAILGDSTIGLAERLVERGARLVHAYDPEAARVAEALARTAATRLPHPSFAVLEGDLGVRDGAFDAVILPDLSLFPDPAEVLRRARRLVSDAGAVVVATPNPEAARALVPVDSAASMASSPRAARRPGPDYYSLYDLVSLQFRVVRMIGQAPFVGYTVAEFAQDGEPEVSIDMSLLPGSEEPEWFLALASERPIRLEPFSVVELPFAELQEAAFTAAARVAAPSTEALAEVEARAARLEVELADLRARYERERDHEAARVEARAEAAAAASARIAELEAELNERGARFKDVEARAGDAHVRAERNAHKIRDLDEELRTQRDRAARLAKQLDDEKKVRTKIELELGMIRNRPDLAGAKDRVDALTAELEAARAQISEFQGSAIELRAARAQIAELERSAVELRAARAQIAELERSAVELRAARARIAELEARSAAPTRPDPALMLRVEELESAVATARREMARLSAERDGARARLEDMERSLAEERRGRREAADRLAAVEAQRADLSRARQERQELEQQLARAERERRAIEDRHRAEGARQEAALARLEELERQVAALTQRNRTLQESEARAAEAAAAEIAGLEAALRERGRVVTQLEADLRESERVGRELVEELGVLFETQGAPRGGRNGGGSGIGGAGAGGGNGGGGARAVLPGVTASAAARATASATASTAESATASGGGEPLALRQHMDTLAQGAARCEADLQAAQWRIAQLERELEEARDTEATPARVHAELEQALIVAHAQIEALRRATIQPGRAPSGRPAAQEEPPPAVIEQAVLLHQLAAAAP